MRRGLGLYPDAGPHCTQGSCGHASNTLHDFFFPSRAIKEMSSSSCHDLKIDDLYDCWRPCLVDGSAGCRRVFTKGYPRALPEAEAYVQPTGVGIYNLDTCYSQDHGLTFDR